VKESEAFRKIRAHQAAAFHLPKESFRKFAFEFPDPLPLEDWPEKKLKRKSVSGS